MFKCTPRVGRLRRKLYGRTHHRPPGHPASVIGECCSDERPPTHPQRRSPMRTRCRLRPSGLRRIEPRGLSIRLRCYRSASQGVRPCTPAGMQSASVEPILACTLCGGVVRVQSASGKLLQVARNPDVHREAGCDRVAALSSASARIPPTDHNAADRLLKDSPTGAAYHVSRAKFALSQRTVLPSATRSAYLTNSSVFRQSSMAIGFGRTGARRWYLLPSNLLH